MHGGVGGRAASTPLGSLTYASETGIGLNSTTTDPHIPPDFSQSKMALLAFEADFKMKRGSTKGAAATAAGKEYFDTLLGGSNITLQPRSLNRNNR